MSNYLTPEQYALLMDSRGIHKDRVSSRDGYAYVEAHDIKAAMIRVFGFERWSWQINTCQVQREQETVTKSTNKPAWCISALVHGTLTVCAPDGTLLATYDGVHAGSSTHPEYGEALGNAVTNADSYAFKRAAIMALGTQGGLGLYNRGSLNEIVRWTLVKPPKPKTDGEQDEEKPDTDDVPVIHRESLETPEPGPDPRTTSQTPAASGPQAPTAAGPVEGGVAPVAPPSTPPDDQHLTTVANEIRDMALGKPEPGYSTHRWLAHVQGTAVKRGGAAILKVPVESSLSPTQVALKVFLEECLKGAMDREREARAS